MMKTDEKRGLLSIGKMAKVNRVTIATLRLYDEMGLLRPSYIDTETGYRYYDIRQTSRLDFIRYMRELGLSLSDIQDLLQREDIALIGSENPRRAVLSLLNSLTGDTFCTPPVCPISMRRESWRMKQPYRNFVHI